MSNKHICHHCLGTNVVKKGLLRNKQGYHRYGCKDCKRSFVPDGNRWFVSQAEKELIDKLLLERVSLRGICRVMAVSLPWLLAYIKVKYAQLPDELHFSYHRQSVKEGDSIYIKLVDCQADELWSFVYTRSNVYYVWIAMHSESRQVIAFYVGDRSRESAKKLWEKIPQQLKESCLFHTDDWDSYKTVIPQERHLYSKIKRYTNYIERFNNTLRQRVSRLVRETMSFSKKIDNHIGAIKFFICHYNLQKQAGTQV